MGGAHNGAAGVGAPRVVVVSEGAVRAAVLMVVVAMAEVEIATVVMVAAEVQVEVHRRRTSSR